MDAWAAAEAAAQCQPDASAQPLRADRAVRAAPSASSAWRRAKIREAALRGDIPGVIKASW